jgi:hypothetical protein
LINQHLSKKDKFSFQFQNKIIDEYGNFLYYEGMKNLSNNDE